MAWRKIQNWLIAVMIALCLVVYSVWLGTKALRSDLAAVQTSQQIRDAYSDTLIGAFRTVDSLLAVQDSINAARLDSLETRIRERQISGRRRIEDQLLQINAAINAQAKAIRHKD